MKIIKEYEMGYDNPLMHLDEESNELRFMNNGEYLVIIDLDQIPKETLKILIEKLRGVAQDED